MKLAFFFELNARFLRSLVIEERKKKKIESSASQYTPLLFCLRLRVCPQM